MISKENIRHLAKLARISLDVKEEETIAEDIESILVYVDRLKEVDVAEVGPTTRAEEIFNSTRLDSQAPESENVDLLRSQFPKTRDGYLKVKNVFGHD